jgi:hypothetical protein
MLPIDAVRRLTQSEAMLLEVALASLLCRLAFCAAARFAGRDPRREKRLFGTGSVASIASSTAATWRSVPRSSSSSRRLRK